ncbi:MAG: 3-isopropylmalate dehydratase large subunit [Saprospiraceae bacterium]|nr:3-isopropylmalate dehydratase large subunit [Saprospiraceae bacterium]
MGKTLLDKIWDKHVVKQIDAVTDVLYIDRHFVHEVTSPQAFSELKEKGLPVFRINNTVATADHNVPTKDQHLPIQEALSRKQVDTLIANCKEFGVELYGLGHPFQGIVHVIGPELGLTLPGITAVCGDSHTSTHGALGAVAFGIGTSQVAQTLAAQCLIMKRPKKMRISVNGSLGKGVTPKDVILYIASQISTSGATDHFIEFAGTTFEAMSIEGRMTVCNMSIELGARGGLVAPDQKTFDYLKGRKFLPKDQDLEQLQAYWKTLYSDNEATFDKEVTFHASDIDPMITYGTNPGLGIKIQDQVPLEAPKKSLEYMAVEAGQSLIGKRIENVFIGSCTNARIEDLRLAASLVKGRTTAPHVNAMVIPGSKQVEKQAIEEGLDKIFEAAGFQFRQPGCSACLGMNEDKVPKGEYCVSTSNRNFEGRQGVGARTMLASPLTAAACAITGTITDVREMMSYEEV